MKTTTIEKYGNKKAPRQVDTIEIKLYEVLTPEGSYHAIVKDPNTKEFVCWKPECPACIANETKRVYVDIANWGPISEMYRLYSKKDSYGDYRTLATFKSEEAMLAWAVAAGYKVIWTRDALAAKEEMEEDKRREEEYKNRPKCKCCNQVLPVKASKKTGGKKLIRYRGKKGGR